MLLAEQTLKECLTKDRHNMSDVVLGAHIIDTLTMVNEKGGKNILEPMTISQTAVVILADWSFITGARIAADDVHKVLFSRQRDDHGEMRKT